MSDEHIKVLQRIRRADEGWSERESAALDAAIAALGGVKPARSGADIEALVVAMAENYEMYADEGHYTPSDRERMLLLDFAHEVAEALTLPAPPRKEG